MIASKYKVQRNFYRAEAIVSKIHCQNVKKLFDQAVEQGYKDHLQYQKTMEEMEIDNRARIAAFFHVLEILQEKINELNPGSGVNQVEELLKNDTKLYIAVNEIAQLHEKLQLPQKEEKEEKKVADDTSDSDMDLGSSDSQFQVTNVSFGNHPPVIQNKKLSVMIFMFGLRSRVMTIK